MIFYGIGIVLTMYFMEGAQRCRGRCFREFNTIYEE